MAIYDPAYRGEADPGAGELGLIVETLERAEQPVGMRHVEAGAVVAHEENGAVVAGARAELDLRLRSPGGELPGVREEVLEHDSHELAICLDRHAWLDCEPDRPARLATELVGHGLRDGA